MNHKALKKALLRADDALQKALYEIVDARCDIDQVVRVIELEMKQKRVGIKSAR